MRDYRDMNAVCPCCGADGIPDADGYIDGVACIYDCPECKSFWQVEDGKITRVESYQPYVVQAKFWRWARSLFNRDE